MGKFGDAKVLKRSRRRKKLSNKFMLSSGCSLRPFIKIVRIYENIYDFYRGKGTNERSFHVRVEVYQLFRVSLFLQSPKWL